MRIWLVEDGNDLDEVNAILGGKYLPGELLRWKDMVLAAAEVNDNLDEFTVEQIRQVAETLPIMPLDLEHKQDSIVGVFTDAREEDGKLLTDGIIYARRFPSVAQGVMDGTMKPSVEAMAEKAVCSICGGVFDSTIGYCDHLRDKRKYNAVRRFDGRVWGVGGGVVKNPASPSAGFNTEGVFLVAHVIDAKKKWTQDVDLDEGSLSDLGWPSKQKIGDAVESGEVTYQKAMQKLQYLINVSKDQATISTAKEIAEYLRNRFRGKTEGGMKMEMTLEEALDQLNAAKQKLAEVEAELNRVRSEAQSLKDELNETKDENGQLKKDKENMEQTIASLNETVASLELDKRRRLLDGVLSDEEFDKYQDVIAGMPEDALLMFASKVIQTDGKGQPVVELDEIDESELTL